MRIGIDIRPLMQARYSGVSHYTLHMLRALFAHDTVNQYVLFYNSHKEVVLPKFIGENITYCRLQYPNKLFNAALAFLRRPYVDELMDGVDVLYVPNLNFISWSPRCQTVMTVHDLSFMRFPEFFGHKMRLWHQITRPEKIFKKATALVAVSENTKRDLVDLLGIGPDKIKVLYEGVDPDCYVFTQDDPRLSQVREKYHLPQKFILYLGTLEPRKNIETLIEAYQTLETDAELVIAGGAGWKTESIYKLAKNNSKIHFIGYINAQDKGALYNLAHIFVYPSYYEGFGLPLLEAMACGVPVIAGSNSAQVEVVVNSGILIDPYNVNDVAQAIQLLLSDQDVYTYYKEAGLKRAEQFSWDKAGKQLLQILTNTYENRH
jgi:glycosyltransferase involved in cell wall biosynthesis